jgi:monoamine oxidase
MSAKDAGSSTKNSKNQYKVIIIGAGIAGLSAANHLTSNAINDYKILEARNRIGGRIISIEMSATRIELGANWIHGVLGNPIFELAMQYNLIDILQTTPQNRKVIALIDNGKQVPFDILQEIYEAYLIFLKRCEEYFLCTYSPPEDIYR